MKYFATLLLTCLAMLATAQNTWEMPEQSESSNPIQKYLAGAVPEIDGQVVFQTTIEAPGKSQEQIFNVVLEQLKRMTQEPNQIEQSRIVLADSIGHTQVAGKYQEWLVFKNKPAELDRTRLLYHLVANCADGQLHLSMMRISYIYEEERDVQRYLAEEWITDRYGLNKKQTKLSRMSGKFRRKTIDRKDYIFNKFAQLLK